MARADEAVDAFAQEWLVDKVRRVFRVAGQAPDHGCCDGDSEFNQVMSEVSNPHRDIFFDAPLDTLDDDGEDQSTPYSRSNCYYASVSFQEAIGKMSGKGLSSEQLDILRG